MRRRATLRGTAVLVLVGAAAGSCGRTQDAAPVGTGAVGGTAGARDGGGGSGAPDGAAGMAASGGTPTGGSGGTDAGGGQGGAGASSGTGGTGGTPPDAGEDVDAAALWCWLPFTPPDFPAYLVEDPYSCMRARPCEAGKVCCFMPCRSRGGACSYAYWDDFRNCLDNCTPEPCNCCARQPVCVFPDDCDPPGVLPYVGDDAGPADADAEGG